MNPQPKKKKQTRRSTKKVLFFFQMKVERSKQKNISVQANLHKPEEEEIRLGLDLDEKNIGNRA